MGKNLLSDILFFHCVYVDQYFLWETNQGQIDISIDLIALDTF